MVSPSAWMGRRTASTRWWADLSRLSRTKCRGQTDLHVARRGRRDAGSCLCVSRTRAGQRGQGGKSSSTRSAGRPRRHAARLAAGRAGSSPRRAPATPRRRRVCAFAIDPSCPRFYTRRCEPVAQMVEHLTFNQVVDGSIPSGLTSKNNRLGGRRQIASEGGSRQGNQWGNARVARPLRRSLAGAFSQANGSRQGPETYAAPAPSQGTGRSTSDSMMAKIGRNQPCPCGSGQKFKKCHGRLDGGWPPRDGEPDVLAAQERIRQAQQGLGRPIIAAKSHGHQIVAVGNTVYWSNSWKTFLDFLADYIKRKLAIEWGNAEIAKPLAERHPLMQWYDAICRYQQRTIKNSG